MVDQFSKEDMRLAIRALSRKALVARRDPAEFFEMAIRHETTKKALHVAAHQRVLFSFALAHKHCDIRLPIDHAKTYSMAALGLWLTGNDVTQRGAIVSHSIEQSKKILRMFKDYLEDDDLGFALRQVFPHLRRSTRVGDPWTQDQVSVERPAGIRDATVRAIGIGAKISGSRLSWVLTDDLVDDTNSTSPGERNELEKIFTSRILSRMDPDPLPSRVVVTNTPWDREDLTFYLEKNMGFATLIMDIDGFVRWTNADGAWVRHALDNYLRPSMTRSSGKHDWYRLRAHDPDPDEVIPLWPERRSRENIEVLRRTWLPHEFARLCMCEPFSDDQMRCQREWIERCKARGAGTGLTSRYDGNCPTFTGVDLAIGKKKKNDLTVLFTIAIEEDQSRRVLNIESGRWTGPEIVKRILETADAYGSTVAVESNAAQLFIQQFASSERKDLRIIAHSTQGANKSNQEFGVEGVFAEMQNGAWIIPCEFDGHCDKEVQSWIDECLYYQPQGHSGDRLMASWICCEASRKSRRGGHGSSSWVGNGTSREGLKMGQF
jgi:hypothetical protein